METFFKHGGKIYGTTLIVATFTFIYNLINKGDPYLLMFSVLLFYVAGNLKFAHGILFNTGGLKRYNQLLCFIFNALCLGYVCYYLLMLFGIISP